MNVATEEVSVRKGEIDVPYTFEIFLQAAYDNGLLFKIEPKDQQVFVYHVFSEKFFGPNDKRKMSELLELLKEYFLDQWPFLTLFAHISDIKAGIKVEWKRKVCYSPDDLISLSKYINS